MEQQITTSTATNVTKVPAVLTGEKDYGHSAKGFAYSAMLRQLGFLIGNQVLRASNPARQQAVMDKRTLEALGEDDSGLPKPVVLDIDSLATGYAAAFRLLRNHIKVTNPETGKPDVHMLKFLVTPTSHIERAAEYSRDQNAASNIAQTKSNAAMLFAKTDAEGKITNQEEVDAALKNRIDAINEEAKKSVVVNATPAEELFLTYLTENKDEDTEELIAMALEGLTKNGENPTEVIRRAADAYNLSMKDRVLKGKFVKIDAGIFALAKMA